MLWEILSQDINFVQIAGLLEQNAEQTNEYFKYN